MDAWLFDRIYGGLHQPPWLAVLSALTHLGDPASVLLLAMPGFLEGVVRRRRGSRSAAPAREGEGRLVVLPWLGIPLAAAVTSALKGWVNRPRPAEALQLFEIQAGVAGWPAGEAGRSFPSGHATLAFALAAVLSIRWPKGRLLWRLLAGGVALSRVGLGFHWPTDVLVGALIGWGSVQLFKKEVKRCRLG